MEAMELNFEQGVTGLAREDDPDTSQEAAALVDASKLFRAIYRVMLLFGEGGCTTDQVADALPDIPIQSITPRFVQMEKLGYIERTGDKRMGNHGRLQEVKRVLHPPFIPKFTQKPKRSSAKKVAKLEAMVKELESNLDKARAFARDIIAPHSDVDGGDIQDAAERHGLVAKEIQVEPCSEEFCACNEVMGLDEFPLECYRYTAWMRDTG